MNSSKCILDISNIDLSLVESIILHCRNNNIHYVVAPVDIEKIKDEYINDNTMVNNYSGRYVANIIRPLCLQVSETDAVLLKLKFDSIQVRPDGFFDALI